MNPINKYSDYPPLEEDENPIPPKNGLGRRLFYFTSHFYEIYAPWDLQEEEKAENLKHLSIIMRICNVASLNESEEQKALYTFHELKEGLEDGTIKRKEIYTLLKKIQEILTEKNTKSKVICQLMELDYHSRNYHISLDECKNFQHTIDDIIANIAQIPGINAKAISREIALIPSKELSRNHLRERLHLILKEWLPK